MNKNSKQTVISIVLTVICFAAVFVLSGFLERNRPAPSANFEDEDLSLQGAKIKPYALGFEGMIADWYWMKSLQYIGDKVLNSKEKLNLDDLNPLNPRLLYPYLDNATTLDPKFMGVYEYGAFVLPSINKEHAIKLTEKGIENNPDSWRLYHYLGFIHWRLGNYEKAAEIYQKGSQIAGAADFMKSMAAKMNSEGGSRDTAREIYGQMFAEAQDAQAKQNAALHLWTLDSLDEREAVQKKLDEFKLKNNRCANNWREIAPLLQAVKLPGNREFRVDNSGNLVDPSDAPYILEKTGCTIKLDEQKTKIILK